MHHQALIHRRLATSSLLCWCALSACVGPTKQESAPPEDSTADEDSTSEDSPGDDSEGDDSEGDDSEEEPEPVDADGDGRAADVDCDDSDPDVFPGAYERCDDGIENDCDGAMDCADTACAAETDCVEDCADGLDNDRDALIDCEDGDCATEAACAEDCGDGVDGDGDSFVDCLDDDCWASCEVKVTRQLHGGSLSYSHERWLYSDVTWGDSTSGTTLTGEARSLSGSIEVSGPDGVIQCRWAVPRAEFWFQKKTERSFYNETSSLSHSVWPIITSDGAHVADSVTLAPGCPLPGDAVLPSRLIGASLPTSVGGLEQIYFSSGTWYSGSASVIFSSTRHSKTHIQRFVMEIETLNPVTAHFSP